MQNRNPTMPHQAIADALIGQRLNSASDLKAASALVGLAGACWFKPEHRPVVIGGLTALADNVKTSGLTAIHGFLKQITEAVETINAQPATPPVQRNGAGERPTDPASAAREAGKTTETGGARTSAR